MNISTENQVMIFKREYQGNIFYSLGLSKKNQDNTYTNGYMPCQFKKGVQLEDKTKIYIKKAWLSFYLKDKETKPYIFISEYTTLEQTIDNSKKIDYTKYDENPITGDLEPTNDPFAEFGEEVSGMELPF